jgi:transposase InsO family protein
MRNSFQRAIILPPPESSIPVPSHFVWSHKHEWTNRTSYSDLEDVRLNVFKYIATSYNPVRLHQKLGYRTPK